MSHDVKCHQLAESILAAHERERDEHRINSLAEELQVALEKWLIENRLDDEPEPAR